MEMLDSLIVSSPDRAIFEVITVATLKVSVYEHYILVTFMSASLGTFLMLRSENRRTEKDSSQESVLCFNKWIGTHVHASQYGAYLLALFCGTLSLLLYAYLSITTVCYNHLKNDYLLVPDDCGEAYSDSR